MAAARRSEQRRLINYIRMSDYMLCDTLRTLLLETAREVLAAMRPRKPSVGSASLRRSMSRSNSVASRSMASSLSKHSMRVRSGSSSSGPLVPITAAAAAAAAEEAAAATASGSAPPAVLPVFEVEVLLDEDDEEPTLRISPNPAEFMVSAELEVHCWCCVHAHCTALMQLLAIGVFPPLVNS
jgi:dynein heavy chain